MIHDVLFELVKTDPNKVGLVTSENKWTYKEILHESLKVTEFLKERKIKAGTHIGLLFENHPSFIFCFFGISMLNCVSVPLPANSTEEENKKLIKLSEIKYCLYNKKKLNHTMLEWIDWQEIKNNKKNKSDNITSNNQNDLAIIFASSGSTGSPKLIMLTHYNITTNAKAHSDKCEYSDEDLFYCNMPLHFSSTITTQILACFISRTAIFISRSFLTPKRFLYEIDKYNITCLALVPTTLGLLMSSFPNYVNNLINTIIVSGSFLHSNIFLSAKKMFPNADILQTYGLTEASPRVSMMERGVKNLSCGKPVEGVEIKIIKNTENRKSIYGEITIKGDNIMLGYYKNSELTSQVIKNGWLYTGDIGFIDNDGCLNIIGRKKNIIIVGGKNVYPEEVEEVLSLMEIVDECIVIKEDHYLLGEIPIAYLKLKSNSQLINVVEFENFCRVHLSEYKIPKKWIIVNKIPKTATGKYKRDF